jgi:hypothetical protein
MQKGVRQGDPLSPLLFVLVADLLQSITNKDAHMGLLKHPWEIILVVTFQSSNM